MNLTFDLSDSELRKLERRMQRLGVEIAVKSTRSALMKASKPMFDAARANALRVKDSGALAVAMGRWSRKGGKSQSGFVSVFIGPRSRNKKAIALWQKEHNLKRPPKGIYHGHMTEYGTSHSRPTPFLRPAFQATARGTIDRFGKELAKAIDRFAAKAGKR